MNAFIAGYLQKTAGEPGVGDTIDRELAYSQLAEELRHRERQRFVDPARAAKQELWSASGMLSRLRRPSPRPSEVERIVDSNLMYPFAYAYTQTPEEEFRAQGTSLPRVSPRALTELQAGMRQNMWSPDLFDTTPSPAATLPPTLAEAMKRFQSLQSKPSIQPQIQSPAKPMSTPIQGRTSVLTPGVTRGQLMPKPKMPTTQAPNVIENQKPKPNPQSTLT